MSGRGRDAVTSMFRKPVRRLASATQVIAMIRRFAWLGLVLLMAIAAAMPSAAIAQAEPITPPSEIAQSTDPQSGRKPVIPPIEQLSSDPLAFNSWCFNVLLHDGPRLGYPDAATRQQAAFAMGESATRFLRLSEAAGMRRDAMVAYDQAMLAETAARAEAADRSANGSLTGTERALHAACMANGLSGMRAKALYVDPNEGMHGRMWCTDTLTIMTQRGLIEGGPEATARAYQAIQQSELLRTRLFGFLGIPESDRSALKMGYLYLALIQVEAFSLSGDKSAFEAKPENCLGLAALRLDDDAPDPPPPPPDRPVPIASGWDYPLSADFRFNAWCYGAMQFLTDGNMPADSSLSVAEAEGLIIDLHFRMLREAKGLRLSDDTLAQMEVDSYHQAAYEFSLPPTSTGELPLSYSYPDCARAEVNFGELLDIDSLQEMVDGFLAPAPDAEFNDAVWCLAGLERVLGSETDREKRSDLKEGLQSLSNTAARLGRELGLSGETMMARLTEMKPIVDEEIRSRRRDDGKLMIAVCLERGLGYSDVFYDWVDPE